MHLGSFLTSLCASITPLQPQIVYPTNNSSSPHRISWVIRISVAEIMSFFETISPPLLNYLIPFAQENIIHLINVASERSLKAW